MNDSTTPVSTLRAKVQDFVSERNWQTYHSPKNLAISIAVEAGELMEVFQWLTPAQANSLPETKKAKLEEELADVLIYCLSMANCLGIDVTTAVLAKLEKNAGRYPAGVEFNPLA